MSGWLMGGLLLGGVLLCGRVGFADDQAGDEPAFDPNRDLLSLHYDHAPDKDDGHSAAADRSMLETIYGADWLPAHTLAVSGAYGKNKKHFNPDSDAVMDAVWNPRGGWVAAHDDWDQAVEQVYQRWVKTLAAGGDVWVKEGGQSDLTAQVLRKIHAGHDDIDTTKRIHVVQHSDWNENMTGDDALAFTRAHTDYTRIRDANAYLNVKGGHEAFEKAALSHPVFAEGWEAAFAYYPTRQRLDFSDTGELMHILGLGEVSIDAFAERYLAAEPTSTGHRGARADAS